jgi:hypothetical protein
VKQIQPIKNWGALLVFPITILLSGTVVLASGCHPPLRSLPHAPTTYKDSVAYTAAAINSLVRAVDATHRADGTLPPSLQEALQGARAFDMADAWGNPLAYGADGPLFWIASGGRDGVRGTEDDIVALARLGRHVPCELRTPFVTHYYSDRAPRCEDTPHVILPLCPETRQVLRHFEDLRRVPSGERVERTGTQLVRLAWIIDMIGREVGAVPPEPLALAPELMMDAWGATVRYRTRGDRFEIRSAGADRRFWSADDVVVEAELAVPRSCVYWHDGRSVRCEAERPPCDGGGLRMPYSGNSP